MKKTVAALVFSFLILSFKQGLYSAQQDQINELLNVSDLVFLGELIDSEQIGETLNVRIIEMVKGAYSEVGKIVFVAAPEPVVNVVLTSLRRGVFFLQRLEGNLYRITSGSIGLFTKLEPVINELCRAKGLNKSGTMFLIFSWAVIIFLLIFSYSRIL